MQQKNSLVSRNDHVAASANDEETGSGDGFETAKPNLRLNLDFLKDNRKRRMLNMATIRTLAMIVALIMKMMILRLLPTAIYKRLKLTNQENLWQQLVK